MWSVIDLLKPLAKVRWRAFILHATIEAKLFNIFMLMGSDQEQFLGSEVVKGTF